ncbi:MAG: 4Fe-4S binding protein [Spirochaetes bacterium]|jgi:Fe-S-cluster-containing hydrogenase component 2|nr:4Fe-4S binding protein [Spirochaetota bacterium]
MAVKVNVDKCTGCGSCVEICPVDAIVIKKKKANINTDDCIECGSCVDECSEMALTMEY